MQETMSMSESAELDFIYRINTKNRIKVISLIGDINLETISSLNTCAEEAAQEDPLYFVLNCAAFNSIQKNCFRDFTLFQKKLRDVSPLVFCNVSRELFSILDPAGVVRSAELRGDLTDALKFILIDCKKRQS